MRFLVLIWGSLVEQILRCTDARSLESIRGILSSGISRGLVWLRRTSVKLETRYAIILDGLSLNEQRTIAASSVAAIHMVVFLGLFFAFRSVIPIGVQEVEVALGAPVSIRTTNAASFKPLPVTVEPSAAVLPKLDLPVQPSTSQPAGFIDVTEPAQAIAADHAFPVLPADLTQQGAKMVRLLISITPSGTIDDATIDQSSGDSDLDELAIMWVKAHWRYTPAMRDGQPVAVTTTVILVFSTP